jgi:hypothetical protein
MIERHIHIYHAAKISVEDIAGITHIDTAAVRKFLRKTNSALTRL